MLTVDELLDMIEEVVAEDDRYPDLRVSVFGSDYGDRDAPIDGLSSSLIHVTDRADDCGDDYVLLMDRRDRDAWVAAGEFASFLGDLSSDGCGDCYVLFQTDDGMMSYVACDAHVNSTDYATDLVIDAAHVDDDGNGVWERFLS